MAYLTLLTTLGQAKLATALANGTGVAITQLAVGDGSGASVVPSASMTALVREKYRASVQSVTVDPSNPNYIIVEAVIPSTVGGWTIREAGLFDSAGQLFAVANFPDTVKPLLAEGSARDLVIRIVIQVSNASTVQLLIDPSVVLASQSWVLQQGFVKKAGDTMTGPLVLPGNATQNLQAVPKQQLDAAIAAVDLTSRVAKSGDAMTGFLSLSADPTLSMHAATKNYVDAARGVDSVPIGEVIWHAGSTPPTSFLVCDGSAVSRTTYDVLFARLIQTAAVTITVASPAVFTWTAHGRSANDPIKFTTTGALPTGLTAGTTYYVVGASITANTFTVSATSGGTAINTSGTQSGTHTAIYAPFGEGNGTTTFNLPDLRGEFIRGWDSGRGVDTGRAFGSAQTASGLGHIGTDATSNQLAMSVDQVENNTYEGYSYPGRLDSGQAGTATQKRWRIRPRNVAMLPCIKARLLTNVDIALMQQAQSMYLLLSGGTLTGALTLFGNATQNLQAVTKQQMDAADALNVALASFTGTNQSLAASGFQKLPGGLIIQWGSVSGLTTTTPSNVTFPVSFPTACRQVVATMIGGPSGVVQVYSFTASGCGINLSTSFNAGSQATWIAIGN